MNGNGMKRHVITWVEHTTRQVVFYTFPDRDPIKTFYEGVEGIEDIDIETLDETMTVVACIPSL